MKSKFFIAGNRIINGLFCLFFGLTLIFALISPNMTIGDNSVFGTSTTLATTFFVLGSIAFIIAVYCYPKVQQFLTWLFVTHRYGTVTVFVLEYWLGKSSSSRFCIRRSAGMSRLSMMP
ncbi:hypothetical protein OM428_08395 [Enterococcus gallinarum]|nr:hypothetical protein [Enterococcus gallinarum]